MEPQKRRQANFELLRIIAMLMVITLHYLTKGNVTVKLSVDGSLYNHVLWLLEAFCNVSVNVYVLISGYFLVESKWHSTKLIELIAQVLFYSILIPVIMMAVGQIPFGSFSIYHWINVILPIQMEHYWFATAYVVLYILAPVLALGVKQMGKKQLEIMIILLLLFFSITKSLNPTLVPTDNYGYDFGWFICLFMTAGYIRLYGISMIKNAKQGFVWYILFSVLTFAICATTGYLGRIRGVLTYYMDMTYSYNYIFVYLASVALFVAITFVKIPDGAFSKLVCKVAPYTFGVYLLHENVAVRDLWPSWLSVSRFYHTPMIFIHLIGSVLLIFIIGIAVDFVRVKIFNLFKRVK